MSSAREAERVAPSAPREPLAAHVTGAVAGWLERADVRRALAAALGLRLAASLFATLVVLLLNSSYVHVTRDVLARGPSMNIYVLPVPLTGLDAYLTGPWLHWDANHLIGIAQSGYTHKDSTAFLPLYPLLVRAFSYVTAGNAVWSALLISTTATFWTFLLLYRLTRHFTGSPRVAYLTLLVAVMLPISFYFVAPYSESLYLALSLACITQALDRHWGTAAIFAVLAALTRQQGLLLGMLALPALWHDAHDTLVQGDGSLVRRLRGFLSVGRECLLFAVAPFLSYVAWLFVLQFILGKGTPIALLTSQQAWNQHFTVPGIAILTNLESIVRDPQSALLHYLSLPLDTAAAVAGLIGLIASHRRMPASVWLYLAACWCIALVKVDVWGNTTSAARYLLALLPLCVVPALWLLKARPSVRIVLCAACAYLWCFYFGEWLLWSWIS